MFFLRRQPPPCIAFSPKTHYFFASPKHQKSDVSFNWLTKTGQKPILTLAIAEYEKGLNL